MGCFTPPRGCAGTMEPAEEHGPWPGQSPPGWVLGRPVYPAVHRLSSWRSGDQAGRAPGLGVKERPPRVRSHGLEGRVAGGRGCEGRQLNPLHDRTDFLFQKGRNVASSQSTRARRA